jgi:hypothetical protein
MSQEIYCIKCKAKTETVNPIEVTSKSGFAKMLQGQCKECNCKKSKLLSSKKPKKDVEHEKEEIKDNNSKKKRSRKVKIEDSD